MALAVAVIVVERKRMQYRPGKSAPVPARGARVEQPLKMHPTAQMSIAPL